MSDLAAEITASIVAARNKKFPHNVDYPKCPTGVDIEVYEEWVDGHPYGEVIRLRDELEGLRSNLRLVMRALDKINPDWDVIKSNDKG